MSNDLNLTPELLRQLDEDPDFRLLLLRQHQERSALGARHAQEYVYTVLAWRKRHPQPVITERPIEPRRPTIRTSTHPLDAICPLCDASYGERCVTRAGTDAKSFHRARVDLARGVTR